MCLTLDDTLACMQLEAAYGERSKTPRRRPAGSPPPEELEGKTVQIRTFIGQDPENGEWRLMTD